MSTEPTPAPPARRRHTTHGDEREQAVVNEASAVGLVAGIGAGYLAALVAAILGSLLWPVVLVALSTVSSLVTLVRAQRRGVDMDELASRAPGRLRALVWAGIATTLLLTLAAMLYTLTTGHGLLTAPELQVAGPEASGVGASLARGAVIGGMVGVVIAVVASLRPRRRRD